MNTNKFRTRQEFVKRATHPKGKDYIIGLDAGYSAMKVFHENGYFCFPSYARKLEGSLSVVDERDILYRDLDTNETFLLGYTAQDMISSIDTNDAEGELFSRKRYTNKKFRILCFAAIALACMDKKDQRPLVIQTGLPSSFLEADEPQMVNALSKYWSSLSAGHTYNIFAGTNPGNQISELAPKTPGSYVYVFPTQVSQNGKLKIHKWSSDSSLTNGNNNYSLEGAEYTIYSDSNCTKSIQTLRVGSDGFTDASKDLTPGTYWVKETKAANKGYQIDTKAHSVKVVAGTTANSPSWLDVYEAPKTTKILLTKSSAMTEITQDNPNYDLSGAVYRVYTDKACTKWTGKSITTDKNGNGKLENLALNEYWVKEYSNPQGYQLDQAVYHVDGRDQWGVNIISVNLTVEENPFTPEQFESTIAIQKVDSETGKPVAVDNGSLANAQFEVKYYRKQMSTNPADSGETPKRTWILKTDENGQIYFKDSYKVSGDNFYYTKDGKVTIPLGTITYEEIKSPNGYLVNSEVITVQIKQDSDNNAAPVYVTPTQKEKALTLTLVKTQAGTDKVIEGAVFEHTLPDGTKEQFTTDADGKIEFQGLQWGDHTIKEISVPDGYSVNKNPITFTVAEDNTVTITSKATETDTNGDIKLTVGDDGNISAAFDEKLAPFDLHINKINNHNKVLEGAEFTVYSDADCKTEVTKGKTDDNGDLTFKDLIPEKDYYLKETKAPQGYRIPVNTDGSDIVYKVRVESVMMESSLCRE